MCTKCVCVWDVRIRKQSCLLHKRYFLLALLFDYNIKNLVFQVVFSNVALYNFSSNSAATIATFLISGKS